MSDTLQDRIAAGLGHAARRLGVATDAFRASSAIAPLALRNRFLRLPAAFHCGKNFDRPAQHGAPLWQAMLDSAYTRPGDYLVQGGRIWFIASQPRLLPVLCVQTNRVVTFARAATQDRVGPGEYAGIPRAILRPLLTDWPASVLTTGAARGAPAHLPADLPPTHWAVLLPAWPGVTLQPGDCMTDELNRTGIVTNAELSDLGWRLNVREASS